LKPARLLHTHTPALRHLRLTFFSKIWRHSWSPSNNFHATTSLSHLLKPEIYYNVRPIVNPFIPSSCPLFKFRHPSHKPAIPPTTSTSSHAAVTALRAKYDLSEIHKAIRPASFSPAAVVMMSVTVKLVIMTMLTYCSVTDSRKSTVEVVVVELFVVVKCIVLVI
jgi:hypothetical protein